MAFLLGEWFGKSRAIILTYLADSKIGPLAGRERAANHRVSKRE